MQTNMLTLNEDVLITLVSYLDSQSARQLSYTARSIHLIAKHRALQSVTLHSIERTTKFCTYMLGDMPHRLPALHELKVHCIVLSAHELVTHTTDDTEESYAAAATLLSELLRRAKNLRVLVMDSAQAWMAYEPQMVDAMASIQTLQEIDLALVGSYTSEFINKMRSAPRKLTFRRSGPLKQGRGRLQLDPQLRLPSVESLSVYDPDNLPGAPDLARAFPGAKRVDLRRTRSFKGLRPLLSTDTDAVPWPTLERVRGSVISFERWKSANTVHLLQLVGQLSSTEASSSWRGRALAGILRGRVTYSSAIPIVSNFQPVALILELDVTAGLENLAELIRGSARLQYLAVAVASDDKDRLDHVASWWGAFCSVLTDSSVLCLEFRVACRQNMSFPPGRSLSGNAGLIPYQETLVRAVEASVGKSTPSTLRYLSLDCSPMGNSPWRYDYLAPEEGQEVKTPPDLRWWSVEGEGTARTTRVLDVGQGERIAAYLRSVQYDYSKPFNERDVPDLCR
ncbi:hypothetical protein DAEQUDRAFT_808494 [Daedalea quercina L-15889]|uniref:F-box domain-containing protein n=1 Tax=Daedalea quercina L-15889 TaxID=1314783 RepID=A0A165TGH0_9APHY|nr:hypothetical protein DAEQUDRAFT_808494 [Daedalea quercina L-15889]